MQENNDLSELLSMDEVDTQVNSVNNIILELINEIVTL
jgi:hypothetical protein